MITITCQPNPRWTLDFIDHVETYGGVAYGRSVTRQECEEQRQRVKSGTPGRRHHLACFEILVDGELAGEVAISAKSSNTGDHEMTIAVFDSYAGKGVAQEALRQFLEQNALWPVSAVVKRGNPNRDAIIAVLTKSGFEDHGGCPDTTFLFTR